MATNHSSDQREDESTPWLLARLEGRPSVYWLVWGSLFLLVLATDTTAGQAATTLTGNTVCLNLVTLLVLILTPARDIVEYLSAPLQKLTNTDTNNENNND